MNVELAEQRILLLPDRVGADKAETAAWSRRTDAFGPFARLGGLISKPRNEDFEIIYRELRLQPFWRIRVSTAYVYERDREHNLRLGAEVHSVALGGHAYPARNGQAALTVTERCQEAYQREWLFDGMTRKTDAGLMRYLECETQSVAAEDLNERARAGAVIVPPQAKASVLTREVISQSIRKIDADRILEETMIIDLVDLCYRPVYALRFRWQTREAVVEVDAVTGEARSGGTTFEAYVGKLVDRDFLLDAGAEALNTFIPGVNLAKIIVVKGLKLGAKS